MRLIIKDRLIDMNNLQLVIKGDFDVLSSYKLVLEIYQMLPQIIKQINSVSSEDNKKSLTFIGVGTYLGKYKVKVILNNKTNVLTIKVM